MTGSPSLTKKSNNLPPENLKTTPRSKIIFGPLGVARILVNIFSTNENQRPPPLPTKTHSIRLITIGVSHYCEKVRWGLDLVESDVSNAIYYTEDAHAPPFCSFATLPASNNQASSTPMIVDSQSKDAYMNESSIILQTYCPFLYPNDIQQQVQDMEANLGKRLGAAVRCFAYHYILQPEYHDVCADICTRQTSKVETILYDKMLDKGVSQTMRKLIHVNEETVAASRDEILQVFDEVSKRLEQHGQPYLMDTKKQSFGFTAADVAFAALAYPLLRPPEMATFCIMDDSKLPPELVIMGEQLKQTTAGQHVLDMYKKHRIPTNYFYGSSNELVYIKSAERNVNPFPKLLSRLGIASAVAVISMLWYRSRQ